MSRRRPRAAGADRPVVLIDGSNVARTSEWRRAAGTREDHDLRRKLVDAVCSWAGSQDHDVVMAFDGVGPWAPGVVRASERVEVEGTGAASGDAVLERRARVLHAAGRRHWVVTSDGALRMVAGARADRILGSDEFVALLLDPSLDEPQPDTAPRVEPEPGSRLGDSLSDDARSRLERMRRGES
ncbi:MAG: YacP-like domain [Thermoleophilia bacterium]|nr:YacP-like domain [Thermoleophilia bacterium]